MVNVSASSFSQMALRHFLEELGWNTVLGTFVLLRFQQLDLNAVEHIQKTQEMTKKYLTRKSTLAFLYCHYILNPDPSGLIPVYSSPVQGKKPWLWLPFHFVLLSLWCYQQVTSVSIQV